MSDVKPITVEKWISDSDADGKPDHLGSLGGWFSAGHRWNDYLDCISEEARPYAEAMRDSVLENEFRFCGDQHQSDDFDGVPLFSDGSVAQFSMRGWGDIMAAIWSTAEDKDMGYIDFYMECR